MSGTVLGAEGATDKDRVSPGTVCILGGKRDNDKQIIKGNFKCPLKWQRR